LLSIVPAATDGAPQWRQDSLEQTAGHHHLSHPEGDGSAVANNFCADLLHVHLEKAPTAAKMGRILATWRRQMSVAVVLLGSVVLRLSVLRAKALPATS
jgi:hypothetical protein